MTPRSLSHAVTRLVRRNTLRAAPVPPSAERVRDVNAAGWDAIDDGALEVLRSAPCWMTTAERLCLYSLVFGLRPSRYLEIGSFRGGSALIVSSAMEASRNPGRMVCVDPDPHIEDELWRRIAGRATLLVGASPGVLEEAERAVGGPFDLVLIDGDHSHRGVLRDLTGVIDRVADRAHLVCHDGYHPDVARAIATFALRHADRIADLGLFTKDVSYTGEGEERTGPWGGLHLLEVRPSS
jgi:predicted O-methyltransferase YrrM